MGFRLGIGNIDIRNQRFSWAAYWAGQDVYSQSAEHATTYLTLPCPYDPASCIHAYVIDFLQEFKLPTWNGYRYWMAYIPLITADQENPCILASADGTTWIEPIGITNPIEPWPGGAQYNADPNLYFDEATSTLYCLFRTSNAYLYEKHSTDGINWSDKTSVINFGVGTDYYTSPSIVKVGGLLWMYGTDPTAGSETIWRCYSTSVTGTWSTPEVCIFDRTGSILDELDIGSAPNPYYIWHSEVRYLLGSYYMAALLQTVNGAQNFCELFLLKSTNGINFKYSKYPVISKFYDINIGTSAGDFAWDMYYYKASFIPYTVGKTLTFKLWYVARNTTVGNQLAYTTISEREVFLDIGETLNSVNAERNAELVKANALTDGYVFGDDCNRADGALGLSSCGIAYGQLAGSIFKISGNKITNDRGDADSSLYMSDMPLNYELIMQVYNTKVLTGAINGGFGMFLKYGGPTVMLNIIEGKSRSKVLRTYTGGTIREQLRIMRTFNYLELTEFKVIMNGTNIKYYINGCLQFDYDFVVGDFSSQATMDAVFAATQILIYFHWSELDSIKNLTIKAI